MCSTRSNPFEASKNTACRDYPWVTKYEAVCFNKNVHWSVLLRSEIPSGMCADLRTVAASNNRDHPTRSLSSSPFASTINCSPGSQASSEVTHQDHSIGITLRACYCYVQSLTSLVSPEITRHDHSFIACSRHIYVWCCSSRTSRSWWITHQRNTTGEVATVLWPALKPNWLPVVPRKGEMLDNMKCSRTFDTTVATATCL